MFCAVGGCRMNITRLKIELSNLEPDSDNNITRYVPYAPTPFLHQHSFFVRTGSHRLCPAVSDRCTRQPFPLPHLSVMGPLAPELSTPTRLGSVAWSLNLAISCTRSFPCTQKVCKTSVFVRNACQFCVSSSLWPKKETRRTMYNRV